MTYTNFIKHLSLVVVFMAIITPAFAKSPNYAPSKTPEEVLANLEKHMNNSDMEGIMSLFTDGSVFINQPGGEPLKGLDAIRGGMKGFLDLKGKADIKVRKVYYSGDTALVIVDWVYSGIYENGEAFQFSSAATDVLIQDKDGNWIYAIDNAFGTAESSQ